jgi:hypothetical protein
MRNDTENVYFYRVKSRDAAGRLTGHIVGNETVAKKTHKDLLLHHA